MAKKAQKFNLELLDKLSKVIKKHRAKPVNFEGKYFYVCPESARAEVEKAIKEGKNLSKHILTLQ